MAPQAAAKAFFLSTLWTTSTGAAAVSTQGYKMTYITFVDRTNLVV